MSASAGSPIPEYLFIDQSRLDRYFEHTKTPPKYAKVASWVAKLTLPVPSVEGSQQKQQVPFTTEDKIELLVDYLRKQGQLAEGRITDRAGFSDNSKVFRLESCEAVKAFLPAASPQDLVAESDLYGSSADGSPGAGSSGANSLDPPLGLGLGNIFARLDAARESMLQQTLRTDWRKRALERARGAIGDFEGLSVWFSDRAHVERRAAASRGQLFLVVGHPWQDDGAFHAVSAHSALVGLFSELRHALGRSVLSGVVAEGAEAMRDSPFQQRFLTDPLGAMAGRGARLTGWRGIQALYRVRTVNIYRDPADDEESFATIGYPIVITATGW